MATVTSDQANRFGAGIDQFEIQRRGTKPPGVKRQSLRLGLRWGGEATNQVLSRAARNLR